MNAGETGSAIAASRPRSRLARGSDLYPLLAVGPYVILAAVVAYTLVSAHTVDAAVITQLATCALAAAWMLGVFTLRPRWQDRPVVMGVFVGGLILIMAVLVLQAPWFGFLVIAGYLYVFALIRWPWQLIAIVALGVIGATAQTSGIDKNTGQGLLAYLAVIVVNVVVMAGFSWINWSNQALGHQRQLMLASVRESNRRLEIALAENAVLHDQLVEHARQAGVLEERQRMAREIHDTLAQGLIGIITQLQAAEQAGSDAAARRKHLEAADRLARESLTDARRSVQALLPEPLRAQHLDAALRDVCEQWSALQLTPVELTITGTATTLAPSTETALLRTAQEALANVAKHAHASRIGLTLSYLDHEVVLDIRDDGIGFDPASPAAGYESKAAPEPNLYTRGGFGLGAMRERVEELAGELDIESAPGEGTAVSARIPLADQTA